MNQCTLCILAVVLCSASAGAGQHNDEHVRLVLNVNAIGLPFEDTTRDYRAVFYVGEPVVATVTLINSAAREVEVEEPWMQRLVVRLRSSNGDGAEIALPVPSHTISGTTRLAAGRKLQATSPVTLAGGTPLPPGRYELEATLPQTVLRNRPVKANDGLIASLPIEVRTVTSPTDELNALHHAAVRARWAGNTRQAKEFLTELLNREPNSPTAHAEQGAVLAAEHNCTGAKRAYERAIALAQSGAASEDRILKNARALSEWVEVGLPERIRNCR